MYEAAYRADYAFEATQVDYRQRLLLERLQAIQPSVVVEIGCGSSLLYARYLEHAKPVSHWIVVEPIATFCDAARVARLPRMRVVRGFFEDRVDAVLAQLDRPPDLVIASSVLHEVADSRAFLAAIRRITGRNTVVHVNVPNAASMHRQLAKAMGLISDTTEMSSRNEELLQYRVYTTRSVRAELRRAGLRVTHAGGYFVKPFTHAQMVPVAATVGPRVMDGLYALGKLHPAIASEIYAEARWGCADAPAVRLAPFDRTCLDRSWVWLNDPEIHALTLSPTFSRRDQLRFFETMSPRRRRHTWAVKVDGRLVGATGLKNVRGHTAEYWGYIGEREYWGRGVGRAMMTAVETEAPRLGYAELDLRVSRENARARALYWKMGYAVDPATADGPVLRMVREL